jgi:hypothetical protein
MSPAGDRSNAGLMPVGMKNTVPATRYGRGVFAVAAVANDGHNGLNPCL